MKLDLMSRLEREFYCLICFITVRHLNFKIIFFALATRQLATENSVRSRKTFLLSSKAQNFFECEMQKAGW
jgi:hypothetical protein